MSPLKWTECRQTTNPMMHSDGTTNNLVIAGPRGETGGERGRQGCWISSIGAFSYQVLLLCVLSSFLLAIDSPRGAPWPSWISEHHQYNSTHSAVLH